MKYPYTNSILGLVSTINQLRSAFPSVVTAETLQKWGFAKNNETYVLSVLQFLGIIDQENKKVPEIARLFVESNDEAFAKKFEGLVKKAYQELFELHGDGAWSLAKDKLVTFFRSADDTSASVGDRQASTFLALAGLSGHGEVPSAKRTATATGGDLKVPKPKKTQTKKAISPDSPTSKREEPSAQQSTSTNLRQRDLGLTVRVEINLPVSDDQAVYDRIFKSLKEHFLNE